ncbi:MAG: hypothetical protein JWL69_4162, partial [Phycisphaerales bacterium]|nr:hypothetical protein [Phycisphaerales bacterium]
CKPSPAPSSPQNRRASARWSSPSPSPNRPTPPLPGERNAPLRRKGFPPCRQFIPPGGRRLWLFANLIPPPEMRGYIPPIARRVLQHRRDDPAFIASRVTPGRPPRRGGGFLFCGLRGASGRGSICLENPPRRRRGSCRRLASMPRHFMFQGELFRPRNAPSCRMQPSCCRRRPPRRSNRPRRLTAAPES